ncbi:MAG: RNA methyltransferase [Ignavibacteria bacterium]|jgi:TrmH family RNA methyltransferase|nr:RNA methyltransferase [Ignavibacteria bacterium]MDH7526829.1 RNA methyltransferase [Ignavibacteria bacterium]
MKIQRITASHLKELSKLKLKKYRDETQTFLVETEKVIDEAIRSDWTVKELFVTKTNLSLLKKYEDIKGIKFYELSENEFKKISSEVTPSGIAALVEKKIFNINKLLNSNENFILALEKISNPGNLGAILRTADWFGFKSVVLSKDSVELTNPKVIRASMGSIFHLDIYDEIDFIQFLDRFKKNNFQIIGTSTKGKSITKFIFPEKLVLIFGNESQGISQEILSKCDEIISISSFGNAESLNLAISSSIILYELRRRDLIK